MLWIVHLCDDVVNVSLLLEFSGALFVDNLTYDVKLIFQTCCVSMNYNMVITHTPVIQQLLVCLFTLQEES